MIIDGCKIAAGSTIHCDICVIGGGVAGLTLVRELAARGSDVLLLESGGTRSERDTQALYKGVVLNTKNHGALDLYRQRRLGGTSTVWGGRCAPYDDIDFASRPFLSDLQWPIDRSSLDPYYRKAHEHLELGDFCYDVHDSLPSSEQLCFPVLSEHGVCTDTLWRFSPPTNFADRHFAFLKSSRRATVYLHANCIKLLTNEDGSRVHYALVTSLMRNSFRVYPRRIVIAAGGLETTRLLLASNEGNPNGLGNDRDLVGRFYMSHITGDAGQIRLSPQFAPHFWNYTRTYDGVYCRRRFTIREEFQRKCRLLNFSAIASPPSPCDPSHNNGILSAVYLMKWLLARRIPPEFSGELSLLGKYQAIGAHV